MIRTKDFAAVINAKLASNPDLAAAVENESFNSDIAMKVYEARNALGLTQQQLADRAGTHQSVISRIEDADYDGHSLTLLKRVAEALGRQLRIEFAAAPESSRLVNEKPKRAVSNAKPKVVPKKKVKAQSEE